MKCFICREEIEPVGSWTQGNNAAPIGSNERCCNECNSEVVVPARILIFKRLDNLAALKKAS